MKKITLIVPCYNEEEVLPLFYEETENVLQTLSEYDYEMIFVDDGSSDNTLEILKVFAKKDSHVTWLSFSRNFGKEAALYAGLCNSNGDYTAVMDADLQDPPLLLPRMLRILETEDVDCVATRRQTRAGEPPVRSWFARRFYRLMNRISDAEMEDGARDFCLMSRPMVDAVCAMSEYSRFFKGIFGWVGFRTHWIAYENVERAAGTTKWSFWNLVWYAVSGIISFSNSPLSVALWVGGFMTAVGVVLLIIFGIAAVFGASGSGTVLITGLIVLIGGMLLVANGIQSLYIARICQETRRRPHYIVSAASRDSVERIR